MLVLVGVLGVVSLLFSNTKLSAAALPITRVSGTLAASQTWTSGRVYVATNVVVPSGKTLTIQPGAIVKVANGATGITVNQGGILNATGTSTSKITFTSYKDDSIGGDTNADAGATVARQGDYVRTVVSAGGSVTIKYGNLRYASAESSLVSKCSSTGAASPVLTMVDSVLNSGITLSCRGAPIILERNQFTVNQGYAIQAEQVVSPIGIVLSGVNKNTFNGSSKGKTLLIATDVPAGKSWDLSSGGGATLLINNGLRNGELKGVLNVDAGTIIKLVQQNMNNSIVVAQGGVLNVSGTATSKVLLTSYLDDSVAGDSTGNGADQSNGGFEWDYAAAITLKGGIANIKFAQIKRGAQAVYSDCTLGNDTGRLSLFDSVINSGIDMHNCPNTSLVIQRNRFEVSHGNPLSIGSGGAPIPLSSGVDFASVNKNTFVGSGLARLVRLNVEIVWGQSYVLSGAGGAIFDARITSVGSLSVDPGTYLKNSSIQVAPGGKLYINGTSDKRVIFTSSNDDSVGGDTYADGAIVPARPGDYESAVRIQSGAGEVSMYGVDVWYATVAFDMDSVALIRDANVTNTMQALATFETDGDYRDIRVKNVDIGITVAGGGSIIFRGSFSGVASAAIQACGWAFTCHVDAAYTNWGGVDPLKVNPNVWLCGSVSISPWVNGAGVPTEVSAFAVLNCGGGPTPIEAADTAAQDFYRRLSSDQIDCSGGFKDACDVAAGRIKCVMGMADLLTYNSPFPMPSVEGAAKPGFVAAVGSRGDAYLASSTQKAPINFSRLLRKNVSNLISILDGLRTAYESC